MGRKSDGPERPRSHVVGDTALNRFNSVRRQEWIQNESSRNDYGWDLFMGLASDGVVQPEDFFVQLKGSDKPDYIAKGTLVSFPLEVRTIKWLVEKPQPSMLAVCDTQKDEQPVYWVWLNDVAAEIFQAKPQAWNQKTVKIHVPVANVLNSSSWQTIEDYVINFHADRKIRIGIGDFILPALGHSVIDNPSKYADNPIEFLRENMGPLVGAGVLERPDLSDEKVIKAQKPEDQLRFQAIRDIQIALKDWRETDAADKIQYLKNNIEDASNYVKAMYYQTEGRLFQQMFRLPDAILQYEAALKYCPADPIIQADLLHAKFALLNENEAWTSRLAKDWTEKADEVLAKVPNECRLIRLKAILIGRTIGPEEAEQFLRNSKSWEREKGETLSFMAHIYSWAGDPDSAERILQEAATIGIEFDAIDWSFHGYVHLKKALGVTAAKIDSPVYATGPTYLDLVSLRRAAECYAKAYRYFDGKGFPTISEETVVNFAVVLRLLGEIDQGIRICRSFLDQHPDNSHVSSALAGFLTLDDRAFEAVPYMKRAFDGNRASSLAFKNLTTCLCQAEEYEELLALAEERRVSGFFDKEEEGLTLTLVVIAYSERGDLREAERWIKHLGSDPELRRYSRIAEATLCSKSERDKNKVCSIFHEALDQYPDDLNILAHFVAELLPLREDTATEIVSCLEKTCNLRQLTAYEYSLLARAYLLLKEGDAADRVLSEGNQRYPGASVLMTEWVNAKWEIGDQEQAFQLLVTTMKNQGPNQRILYNLAVLAAQTGRLDPAIQFFERAESKITDPNEKGIIHRYLYQLKSERGDEARDILRHVVMFGKYVTSPEDEAAYLTMFVMVPKSRESDAELESWKADFRSRLEKFTTEHPRFHGLKSINIPEDVPEEKKGLFLRSALWELLLPHELASAPLWHLAREKALPLVFRASQMPNTSVIDYFGGCLLSEDFTHAIHIFGGKNNLDAEATAASRGERVCIDITGLLTLAELDKLDLLVENFETIVVAQGTRHAVWMDNTPILGIHPLAERVSLWMERNRQKIRIRHIGTETSNVRETFEYQSTPSDILTARDCVPLNILLPEGVGESLMLAERLRIPLYSDESCVRVWAVEDHGVPAFSTSGFARSLVQKGIWSLCQEVDLITDLIKRNYRWVPFLIQHLNVRLRLIIDSCRAKGLPINSEALRQDERMWLLIRIFGESAIRESKRLNWAMGWWLSIIEADFFEQRVLAACMSYPVHCITTPSKGSVMLGKIPKLEREEKAAKLFGSFLWRSYINCERHITEVWLAIKECTAGLFPKNELAVFARMPKPLLDAANLDKSHTPEKRTNFLYDLISRIPLGDKERFELFLLKNANKIK